MSTNYKKYASLLKKNKLINFDLRKKLTPQQKASITKKLTKYKQVLNNPNYVKRHVSKKRAKQLKQLGYLSVGNSVWISDEGYDHKRIKIKDKYIQYTEADKQLKVLLIEKENILNQLQELSGQPLINETVTVRIGSNSQFSQRFDNYNKLLDYVSGWQAKDNPDDTEDLIDQMALVRFYGEKVKTSKRKRKPRMSKKHPRRI